MKPLAALWRLAIAVVVAVLLMILVTNVITNPVDSKLGAYTADFTDASGLHTGADVRVRGVRVGKVDSVELIRRSGQSLADVAFTLDTRYGIDADTRLAVKYQALTGLRYLDVANPSDGAPAAAPVKHIPTSMTVPSFDITALFNGLQPVLATLSPDDLNTFTNNVETFLSGDGSGLGPVLESVHTLTQFLADRQQIVATLMSNLKAVADTMSGHAKDFVQIIDWANRPIDGALTVLDEFRKSAIYGPEFTSSVVQLLDNAGFKPGINIDDALDRALINLDNTMEAFKLVPVMWDNIPPPSQQGRPLECSAGRAELPLPVDVLLNGQKVTLCKQ
ncbi:MAG: phospholipid/cholesterol/gamma-HCH transport system substrate-binding protein [Mycobacterium sp.]|jgi:phospholipid/cholesterol/gamma-HCH transport system substrate-binding protein|nr:phospholipid/cholesterol/gamma-HCH transport system substrate-binding protein [Mycobacterium sp.]MDT5266490.1 phospholipid/cholesterol/gamma-HCH transport system substrate-binding protein [Mycobacterium sp.]